MVQVTVIRLVGYREWTESLGPDREHIIQVVQARIHEALVRGFSARGALAHPVRYDYMVAITNGLGLGEVKEVVMELGAVSPVPPSAGTSSSQTPREAEYRASRLAMEAGPWEVKGDFVDHGEVAVAHIDLIDSTSVTRETSGYRSYEYFWGLINQLRLVMAGLGAVVLYLGGDNAMAILAPEVPLGELEMHAKLLGVRIGIGVAKTGREAMRLATEALEELRRRGGLVMMLRN